MDTLRSIGETLLGLSKPSSALDVGQLCLRAAIVYLAMIVFMRLAKKRSLGRATVFDAILGIHIVPFMVDASTIVARLAALAASVPVPFLHSMMGTLPDKDAWFRTMEAAGVPMFNDIEAMAECAGLLARYPTLRERVRNTGG